MHTNVSLPRSIRLCQQRLVQDVTYHACHQGFYLYASLDITPLAQDMLPDDIIWSKWKSLKVCRICQNYLGD